jgi:hypothetical protein
MGHTISDGLPIILSVPEKDRKSNCLHPSICRRELAVNGLLDVAQDGMERSLGQAKPREALGRQCSGLRKGGFPEAVNRGVGQGDRTTL